MKNNTQLRKNKIIPSGYEENKPGISETHEYHKRPEKTAFDHKQERAGPCRD
jgi:hypothetical protein